MASHLAKEQVGTEPTSAANGQPTRVIIADSQAIFRVGIRKVLAVEDDLRVVAQAESLVQTLSASSSGRLFGPYFWRRRWASSSERPFTRSALKDAATSLTGYAHHGTSATAGSGTIPVTDRWEVGSTVGSLVSTVSIGSRFISAYT